MLVGGRVKPLLVDTARIQPEAIVIEDALRLDDELKLARAPRFPCLA